MILQVPEVPIPSIFFQVLTFGAVNLVIPEKSVSRVHLKIKVGEVPEGNGVGCQTQL